MRAALLIVVALSVAPSASATAIALLPFDGTASVDVRLRAEAELNAQLAAIPGFTVLPQEETAVHHAAVEALTGACATGAPPCMARVAAQASVAYVVGGRLDALGHALDLALVLVAPNGRVVRNTTMPFSQKDPLAAALRRAAVRLLAPELEVGQLAVNAPSEAEVMVDGFPSGTAPLSPMALPPGTHQVVVTRAGCERVEQSVAVTFDQMTVVDIRLKCAASAPADASRSDAMPADHRRSVAVLQIEGAADRRLAGWLARALTATAQRHGGVQVIDEADLEARIDRDEMVREACASSSSSSSSSSSETSCVAQLTGRLGIDVVFSGEVAPLGESRSITLRAQRREGGLDKTVHAVGPADDLSFAIAPVERIVLLVLAEEHRVPDTLRAEVERRPVPRVLWFAMIGAIVAGAGGAAGLGTAYALELGGDDAALPLAAGAVGAGALSGAALVLAVATAPFVDFLPAE